MRTVTILAISLFLSLLASTGADLGALDVLFTGDDHGWLTPSG
jgi:hypothetical protein